MKILIIEDDKNLLKTLKHILVEACFAVDVAEDGERGSFLARTNEYDLIILDSVLPKKNGEQVCMDIRKEKNDVPIIILSVRTETEEKIKLLNMGADDYITKPFSLDELMARIRAILRRPKKEDCEILTVGNLTLNKDSNVVKMGEKEIYLTRKEFILLGYMMENKGKVLSRGMIMEHAWDINADPFSNTIETHILNLRRKIEDGSNKGKGCIHTIPGRGYKIVCCEEE